MEGGSSSSSSGSVGYCDFMGVGGEKANKATVEENQNGGGAAGGSKREKGWPIKRELTAGEVHNDVLYIDKEAFWAYILPNIPQKNGEKLAARGDLQIMVKDERCSFYVANLSLYRGVYVMSRSQNQGHTFVRSRGLQVGQTVWLRWTNGYMEVKVFE